VAQTLVSFVGDIRPLLGDRFGGRTDADIIAVLRAVINTGQVPGVALTDDRLSLSPDIVTAQNWTRLVFNAVLMIAFPDSASNSWRIRAGGESYGPAGDFIQWVEERLSRNEGSLLAGVTWQDLGGFLRGYDGCEGLAERLTRFETAGPWRTVRLSQSGVTSS
jgi:hypothetical protein